jgi:hypothetical protein
LVILDFKQIKYLPLKTTNIYRMKGKTNNPNGRPKGTPNKVTSTIRNWLVELISNNREQLEKDFLLLEPKDRLILVEKFLPYIMPKAESAKDVEGACFSKSDVVKRGAFDIDFEKTEIKTWYD